MYPFIQIQTLPWNPYQMIGNKKLAKILIIVCVCNKIVYGKPLFLSYSLSKSFRNGYFSELSVLITKFCSWWKEIKLWRQIKAQFYTFYKHASFPFNLQFPYVLAVPYHSLNPYYTCISEAHFPMYWYGRSQKAIRYFSRLRNDYSHLPVTSLIVNNWWTFFLLLYCISILLPLKLLKICNL